MRVILLQVRYASFRMLDVVVVEMLWKCSNRTRLLNVSYFYFPGCPAIVIGISAGLASEGYGNKKL